MTWKIPAGMSEKNAEKEAWLEAISFEKRVQTGQIAVERIKLADFADKYISDYAEIQLRPKTVARYKGLMVRIKEALGHIYLDRLRPTHLMEFYKELSKIRKEPRYTTIADLKNILDAKKISQINLANKANICADTIRSIMSGNPTTKETAKK